MNDPEKQMQEGGWAADVVCRLLDWIDKATRWFKPPTKKGTK